MHTTRRTFLKTTAGVSAVAISPAASMLATEPLNQAVSIGVIGAGRQGRSIISDLARIEGATIGAVCDIDERRRDLAGRRARGAETFADYRAMLDNDAIGAVVIATPTHVHKQIAIDALEAGKHIYCEAPLAHTADDCREIVQAARASDRVFHTGMQGRSNPIYKLARSFVLSGSISGDGQMVAMRGSSHQKTSWRDAGGGTEANWKLDPAVSLGLAGEMGVHQFDVFHWFQRTYPRRVTGLGSIRHWNDGREVADNVQCTFEYDDGLTLQYEATLANSFEGTGEYFHGPLGTCKLIWTHGWLFKEADAPTQGWEVYANRQRFHNQEGITLIADATKLASQGKLQEGIGLEHSSLYYALSDFLKSIDQGRAPVCSVEEGMRAALVAIAANHAIRTGEPQEIDPKALQV